MRFRFGAFCLDDESFRLTRGGRPVALRRKVFDLLLALVRERERVVPREELVERLWTTTAVGAGSLSGLVNELRAALGEGGGGDSSIRTVHARGYQFVAPVEVEADVMNELEDEFEGRAQTRAASIVEPGPTRAPVEHAKIDRLDRARFEVARFGARALVSGLADAVSRADWLAWMLVEASEAGFDVRCEVVPGETRDRSGDVSTAYPEPGSHGPLAPREVSGRAGVVRPDGSTSRRPIALGLEIHEPESWARAGGIGRLLDLLGRAPVLVIAALAIPADDGPGRVLVGEDARIEWLRAPGPVASARGGNGSAEEVGRPRSTPLTGILRVLARADEVALESALRGLGFQIARIEPIRAARRVEPAACAAGLRGGSTRI